MCRKYFEILTRTNATLTASFFFLPEIGGKKEGEGGSSPLLVTHP